MLNERKEILFIFKGTSMMHRQTSVFFPAHLPAAELDTNARTILERRYLRKDEQGNVCEAPEELFWRVAWNIALPDAQHDPKAAVQETAETFYRMMADCRFLPNSPCLRGAGREFQQLFACFVLPIEDSLDSIFDTLKLTATIHKSGGGTGFSFSRLRPRNAPIRKTAGVSSGPISFMRVYNAATSEISQGGVRRGANMGILRVDHPDIEEFIDCKHEENVLTTFNISVAINDAFMAAFEENRDYDIIDPHTETVVGQKNARAIFEKIVQHAWQNGEPGIVFIDRINASESNMVPAIGTIESTNPCGEQPLLPYESCVLGSINLAKFSSAGSVAWDALRKTVYDAVHFLDNTIDANHYVDEKIGDMTKGMRRFGLGVMGFADLLIALSIPYNSADAVTLAEEIMGFIDDEARAASEELARTRGVFPFFAKSLYAARNAKPIRNVARTTIAPTGTISTIAGCSSGIEPIFALVHRRKSLWKKDGTATMELLVVNKQFEARARAAGIYSQELMEKISDRGTVQGIAEIPMELRRIFVTSHDIEAEAHVNIQAAFQRHVNNAVSKTINFPHHATPEDVSRAYLRAYHSGCKGITIYRDGSRSLQVLTAGSGSKKESAPTQQKKVEPMSFTPATPVESIDNHKTKCPECGAPIEAGEGCFKCLHCGHSQCS
ncbi:MAG: adenosylcobalamin-dependent ribonucleoside-diphosphate reductase [Candidatus Dependentiae bacterium]|jgi:ribonucleoside-diphosphate reductase alpha chain|nr:adenosylcobalamin-dependent ribonucleoside-diphosphate reductase [Candidatus Dependentiae bacterium]